MSRSPPFAGVAFVEAKEDGKRETPQGMEKAAGLARRYALRGYDAVHLASALLGQERLHLPVTLAAFDRDLWLAGRKSGMEVWPTGLVS